MKVDPPRAIYANDMIRLTRRGLARRMAAGLTVSMLSGAALARPAGRALPGSAIDIFDETRVFLPTLINGVATPALLDTGAEMTVLDLAFARRLGLRLRGSGTAVGTGGVAEVNFADGVEIETSGMSLSSRTVAVIDLRAVGEAIGRPLPVLLGKDLLQGRIMDLDLPNRRIAFSASAEGSDVADGLFSPFPEVGPLRALDAGVEGAAHARFHLDTGSGGALSLYPPFQHRLGLPDGRPASTALAGGVGGLTQEPILTIARLTLGATTLTDVPAVLATEGSAVTEHPIMGSIGMAIVSRFRMVADFGRDRVAFLGDESALRRPFWKNTLGLALVRAGEQVKVLHIMPNSPAAAAGWASNDTILAIDGAPPTDWPMDRLRRLMGSAPGTEVAFTTQRGSIRLTAATFY